FYVEAEDNNDLVSLAIVRLTAVEATFEKPLLVVDDTRFRVDTKERSTDACVVPPTGPWPTRAALDTFRFARGGRRAPVDTPRGGLQAGRPRLGAGRRGPERRVRRLQRPGQRPSADQPDQDVLPYLQHEARARLRALHVRPGEMAVGVPHPPDQRDGLGRARL